MSTTEELTKEEKRLLAWVEKLAVEGVKDGGDELQYLPICNELASLKPKASRDFVRSLKQRIRKAVYQEDTHSNAFNNASVRRKLALSASGVLLIALALLATPGGRAWARGVAQGVLQFFTRSERDTIVIVATYPPVTPTNSTTQTSGKETQNPPLKGQKFYHSEYPLSIKEAEQIAGFDVKEPTNLPYGYSFIGAKYDPEKDGVTLLYVFPTPGPVMDSSIAISQYRGKFEESKFGLIGPEAEVITVKVGDVGGEYVEGGWLYLPDPTTPTSEDEPGGTIVKEFHWERTWVPVQTLRWEEGGFFFEIMFAGSDTQEGFLDLEGLVAIAERLD